MNIRRKGILFIISAPSGAGKTTLCNGLQHGPEFVFSVSCTTRAKRPGEVDGTDYFFLSEEEFKQRVARGDFIEHAQVHGKFYGTLRQTVVDNLDRGVDVLLDIDFQGAAQVRACADATIRDALVDVFLMPPSIELLRFRLQKRATESAEQIELRINNARREIEHQRDYRYTIISGSVQEDIENFNAIITAERQRSSRLVIS
jgi:guanylate kinase